MNYLIVGRPNVGKSSVFNILIRKNSNIIHIDEGTTRDWHRGKVYLTSNSFIYDTPGIILNSIKKKENKIKNIIESLIPEINCFLFVYYKNSYMFQNFLIAHHVSRYQQPCLCLLQKFYLNLKWLIIYEQ